MLRAVATQKAMTLLASSAVAVSHTGNSNETTLATVSVPGGVMGLNGGLLVLSTWTMTNSANNKTLRLDLGGTDFMSVTATTTATFHDARRIRNRNSASSQVAGTAAATGTVFGITPLALTTGAVDTSSDQSLTLTAQLANTGETITLESYEVWLLPE